jgi:hypothetical protein
MAAAFEEFGVGDASVCFVFLFGCADGAGELKIASFSQIRRENRH